MGTPTFLSLDRAIFQPPLPAIVAVLMAAGLVASGSVLARAIRGREPEWIDRAAGFFAAGGLLGAATHELALAGLARTAVLRPLALAVAAVGAVAIWRHGRSWGSGLVWRLKEDAAEMDWLDRLGMVAAVLALVGLSLAALGPPTDADSLEYHLGVPLDWLRHGGAYPRPEWFHARLVGLGEALNLLGLAGGTDTLGAALQATSLLLLVTVAVKLGEGRRDRLLALLLVAACPVMVFLVPNQKPQLMPSAAIAAAVLLAARRWEGFGVRDALLALGAIGMAAGCKYSMLLGGAIAVIVVFLAAWRNRCLPATLTAALASFGMFPLPVFLRNLAWYGDPLSPFLERFRDAPDEPLLAFATYLRQYGGEVNAERLLRLPAEVLVPRSSGDLTTALGMGALAFMAAIGSRRTMVRLLLAAAVGATAVHIALGQVTTRFLLEAYLWAGIAAVVSPERWTRSILLRVLSVQAVGVCCIAAFGMAQLLPGALTLAKRDQAMRRMALGYEEAKWLERILPPESVLLSSNRTRALTPRPFVSTDRANHAADEEAAARELTSLIRIFKPTALTLYADFPSAFGKVEQACGEPMAGPVSVRYAARNPFHLGNPYEVRVVALELGRPACQRLLGRYAPGPNLDFPEKSQ